MIVSCYEFKGIVFGLCVGHLSVLLRHVFTPVGADPIHTYMTTGQICTRLALFSLFSLIVTESSNPQLGSVIVPWTPIDWILLVCFMLVSAIDWDYLIVPSCLTHPTILITLVYQTYWGVGLIRAILHGFMCYGGAHLIRLSYQRWRHRPGFGAGDCTLLGLLGLGLGWHATMCLFLLANYILVFLWMIRRLSGLNCPEKWPFVPFLTLAMVLQKIIDPSRVF